MPHNILHNKCNLMATGIEAALLGISVINETKWVDPRNLFPNIGLESIDIYSNSVPAF